MIKPAYFSRLFLLCLPLFVAMPFFAGCPEDTTDDGDGGGDGDGDGNPDGGGENNWDGGTCLDEDDDGFYTCIDPNFPERSDQVDCDDSDWTVQPGGWEYPDNGVDDNCDGLTDAEGQTPCACAFEGTSANSALIDAMDLCGDSVSEVSTVGHKLQLGVYQEYYGDVVPRKGDCLTVLSSGHANGSLFGSFPFSEDGQDPVTGGPVDDLAQLVLTLTPPSNVKGFAFDFMFLTTEWPESLCTEYKDTFYAVVETLALEAGEPTSISYDLQFDPIDVNTDFMENPLEWTTSLSNTPYGQAGGGSCTSFPEDQCTLPTYCFTPEALAFNGSGTGWLTTKAGIDPEDESISLLFSIHDASDWGSDSTVFLDNFRWLPDNPYPLTWKPTNDGNADGGS